MKKKLILTTIIAFAFLAVSFMYHINDFSGAFVGSRWFGWPTQPISIYKVSGYAQDVEQVKWASTSTLLKEGWKVDPSFNPVWFLIKTSFNYIVFLTICGVFVFGIVGIIGFARPEKKSEPKNE